MNISSQMTASLAIARIRELADDVARLRAGFDRDRRLPDELIARLVQADLFRLAVPRSIGGAQLLLREWFDVMEAAAELDASVAWVLTNATVMSRMSGFLPADVAGDWFASPDCMMAGSTASVGKAEPTTGGFLVTGVWPFASGIHAAVRVMGLCEVAGSDDPAERIVCAFLPIDAVHIRDDWYSSGLRGSGSCTFEAQDVFVPDNHIAPFLAHRPIMNADPYHLPNLSILPLSVTLVAIGILKASLADFTALADRTRGGTSAKLADRELVQTELGRAITLHRAARAVVHSALDEMEAAFANAGAERTAPRALFRASLGQAADLCESAMAILCRMLGTAAILETGTLERRQRDLTAATRHVAMGPHNMTVLGRVHLGLDPGTSRF